MNFRALLRNSLLTIILLTAAFAAPVGAQGSIGGRPANPDPDNPRSQSIFIMDIEAGQTKTDSILVANNTDSQQTIELYAVDGVVSNSGAYSCRQQSEARQGIGSWTTISKDQVTLDAGERREVKFSVTMPKNADVGEHNGCIVFQTPDTKNTEAGNIHVRTRQAVRLVATIPGELHREVNIASFTVDSGQDNRPVYKLSLQNKGNVSADIDAQVLVATLWGKEIYRNGGGYPVIANQGLDLVFEHSADDYPMFGGWYRVQAGVSYDEQAGVFGTKDTDSLINKQIDPQIIFLAPSGMGWLVIVTFIAAAGALIAHYVRNSRQKKLIIGSGTKHVVKSGETVQSVAAKYHISWKKLVSVNKIRPPYVLESGQKLSVPKTTESSVSKNNRAR